jgi:hypothetical protein
VGGYRRIYLVDAQPPQGDGVYINELLRKNSFFICIMTPLMSQDMAIKLRKLQKPAILGIPTRKRPLYFAYNELFWVG